MSNFTHLKSPTGLLLLDLDEVEAIQQHEIFDDRTVFYAKSGQSYLVYILYDDVVALLTAQDEIPLPEPRQKLINFT